MSLIIDACNTFLCQFPGSFILSELFYYYHFIYLLIYICIPILAKLALHVSAISCYIDHRALSFERDRIHGLTFLKYDSWG